jgi:hypothetical protein
MTRYVSPRKKAVNPSTINVCSGFCAIFSRQVIRQGASMEASGSRVALDWGEISEPGHTDFSRISSTTDQHGFTRL